MHHIYQSGSFWFLFICLSSEQIRFLQNTVRRCHKVLSGGRPAPTAGLVVSRPERLPSQSGMRAADSLESGGRMWEISWNVGFFFPFSPHAGATPAPVAPLSFLSPLHSVPQLLVPTLRNMQKSTVEEFSHRRTVKTLCPSS